MAIYNLIKNGKVENTIIADEVDSIRDQYDSIEEVIQEIVDASNQPSLSKTIGSNDVRLGLTFAEKVRWDNSATPTIVTAKVEFQTSRTIEDTAEILQFLVDAGDISQESMDKILA